MTKGLTGAQLARAFRAAADHLAAAASSIDAINVYPVPDGDTGSNMAATLRAAVKDIDETATASEVLKTVARGALYGARGNSGVILSQALRGLAAIDDAEVLTGDVLGRALERCADAAYASMSEPREGTMLTVLRAAATAAEGDDALSMLRSALAGAEAAECETINQLEKLREAGVTDAGGEGICTILRAVVADLAGEPLPEINLADAPLARLVDHAEEYGFCTEFLIEAPEGKSIDVNSVRELAEGGSNRSPMVVGDSDLVRVHVHTDDPDGVIEQARGFGNLASIKVDDMGVQHAGMRAGQQVREGVSLLALCEGDGFTEAFESLGAHVLTQRGQHRPSVQQILAAVRETGTMTVLVLPNHKDLVGVAQQAAELWDHRLEVVPTISLPQGLAAATTFDAERPAEETFDEMKKALRSVTTIECTVAAESRTAEGVRIERGNVIVLVDGKIVAAVGGTVDGVLRGLEVASVSEGSLITLHLGASIDADEETALREAVKRDYPDAELELAHGGQRLYPVIASVE